MGIKFSPWKTFGIGVIGAVFVGLTLPIAILLIAVFAGGI